MTSIHEFLRRATYVTLDKHNDAQHVPARYVKVHRSGALIVKASRFGPLILVVAPGTWDCVIPSDE